MAVHFKWETNSIGEIIFISNSFVRRSEMATDTKSASEITGKIIEAMIAAGLLAKTEDITKAYRIIYTAVHEA